MLSFLTADTGFVAAQEAGTIRLRAVKRDQPPQRNEAGEIPAQRYRGERREGRGRATDILRDGFPSY
jgi:hypothetical protein